MSLPKIEATRCCWHEIPKPRFSEILTNDSIFKEGYDINVFGRNCASREKGVNNFVTLKIAKMIYTESPGILVLIAGDGDYYGTLLEAIDYNWKVEVWFWKLGILNSLNKHEPTDLCTKHLFPVKVSDQFKLSVLFPMRMNTLEITCDTIVEDKEIVEWFANLNLFSWIHREGKNIILYLNNERELNIAKEWIVRERKGISIWEKNV
ncbi:unnamed protein product [Rhizophagus irregularis]|nr:unnamed protein product [Rhizophagus irregularis]